MNRKAYTILQVILITAAILVVLIPILTVAFSGNGYDAQTSHTLISISLFLCIVSTVLGMLKNPEKRSKKIGLIIGLLIVLISQWV